MGQRLESTTWKFRLPGCKIWVSLTLGPCVSSSELGLQQRWAEVSHRATFRFIVCSQMRLSFEALVYMILSGLLGRWFWLQAQDQMGF